MCGVILNRSGDRPWGKDTACWSTPLSASSPSCILQRQLHLDLPAWSGEEEDWWKAKGSKWVLILSSTFKRRNESWFWAQTNLLKRQKPEQEILKGPGKTRRKFWLGNHCEKSLWRAQRYSKQQRNQKRGRAIFFEMVLERGTKTKVR